MDAKRQIMVLRTLLLSIGCFMLPIMSTVAQDTAIDIGTSIEANLSASDIHNYQFVALETTIISIHAQALDAGLDIQLALYDSSGNIVIENDDYNYPDNLDAIIQAFVIPRTDTFTIEISAFGDTSGDYSISLLPGYDILAIEDENIANPSWQVTAPNLMTVTEEASGLSVQIEGIAQTNNILASEFPQHNDYYFEVEFNDINATTNWQVGLVFRYVNEQRFYRLVLSDQGFWQFEFVDDGETVIIQSWSTHPAIVPGEPNFTLGILVSGESYDILYNRQWIGTVYNNALTEVGQVGLTATTANALGSRIAFTIEKALMTIPTQVSDQLIFPKTLVANNYTSLAHSLERQQIIPVGGEVKLTLPENTIRYIEPGVSRFPVASGVAFTEFVMGGILSWQIIGEGVGGCGLSFNDTNDEQYTLAYINSSGEYGVSQRDGDSFSEGIYGQNISTDKESHSIILIVNDDILHFYVDSQYVGNMSYSSVSGEIGTAVVNFDGVDTSCTFNNLWLWSLD